MDDKVGVRLHQYRLKPDKSLSVKCSCSECDSLFCFSKRRLPVKCTCDECKGSQTCLYCSKVIKQSYSDRINNVYLNSAKVKGERDHRELTNVNYNFELERKQIIDANRPPPNSLDEYITRMLPETMAIIYKQKPESLNKYIDIISGNHPSKEKKSKLNMYINDLKEAKPSSTLLNKQDTHFKYIDNTKTAKIIHCKGTCKKCNKNKKITQIQSLMLSPHQMNLNPRTAMLSTQVMNLPYKDSSESISSKPAEISTNDTVATTDFFKCNIFERLKEVYKACSCKVCECIPIKMKKNEVCNCKPCECLQCKRYITTFKMKMFSKLSEPLRCTCTKINGENNKSMPKKWTDCSCKPCNCAKCQNNDFMKPCDCKPCRCIECKKAVPQVQVFLGETYQHSPCNCLPCNCIECTRRVPASSKNLVREVSTTISRHHLETCKCENKNFIWKPHQKGAHDSDINTTTILSDVDYQGDDVKETIKQNIITMFAALPNKYQHRNSAIVNSKHCSCEQCECITCVGQEDAFNAIKSSRLFFCNRKKSKIDTNTRSSDCKACECYVYNRDKVSKHKITYKAKSHVSQSVVHIGNCNKWEYVGESSAVKITNDHSCNCNTHRYYRDEPVRSHSNILVPWPIKKGNVLNSAQQNKLQKLQLLKEKFSPTLITSLTNKDLSFHSILLPERVNDSNKISKCFIPKSLIQLNKYINSSDISGIGTGLVNLYNANEILKYDVYMQCEECYVDKVVLINKYADKTFQNNISEYSSLGTAAAESRLEDNLKSNLRKEIKLSTHNIIPKQSKILSANRSTLVYEENIKELARSVSAPNNIKENNYKQQYKIENNNIGSNRHRFIPQHFNNNEETKLLNKANRKKSINKLKSFCKIKTNKTPKNTKHYTKPVKTPAPTNIRDKISTKKNLNQRSKCFQLMHKVKAPHSSHYNISNDTSTIPIKNDGSGIQLTQPYTYFDEFIKSLNIDEDYKRVHKTLQDAQEFYLHLLGLLETYEKANKEFEIFSDRLKVGHESVVGEKFVGSKDNCHIKTAPDKDLSDKPIGIPKVSIFSNTVPILTENIMTERNVNDNTTISQKSGFTNLKKIVSNQESPSSLLNEPEKLENTNVFLAQNTELEASKVGSSSEDNIFNNLYNPYFDVTLCKNNIQKQSKKVNMKTDPLRKCEMRLKYTYNSNLKMTTIVVPRNVYLKRRNANYSAMIDQDCNNKQSNRVIEELNTKSKSREMFPELTSTNTATNGTDNNMVKFNEIQEIKEKCSFKSNTCNTTVEICRLHVSESKMLDSAAEHSIVVIQKNTLQSSNEESSYDNKALSMFDLEEKDLLKLNKQTGRDLLKIDKEALCSDLLFTNCDDQKIKFHTLRQVSNHSVLVKWRPPRDLSKIQGYELLVDGRTVQKMFSPSKSIAVVTCLPNSDKIPLTIRTITYSASNIKQYPTSTVIYRPRSKYKTLF